MPTGVIKTKVVFNVQNFVTLSTVQLYIHLQKCLRVLWMAQYLTSSPRYWWFYSTLQQDFCLTVPPPSCWLPGWAHSSAFKALEKARVTSVAWKFPAPNAPLYACLLHVEDSFICRNVEVWQSAKSWSSKFHSIFSLELTAFLFGNNFNLRSHQRPAGKVTVLGRFYLFFFFSTVKVQPVITSAV